tara:strand:+ start:85 stop:282 length:198 start_codon:yes stop_codon:yes gene_type:complete
MSVITNQLDYLSEVLHDFCILHSLEFASADDLLYDSDNNLSQYEHDWLNNYIQIWNVISQLDEVV